MRFLRAGSGDTATGLAGMAASLPIAVEHTPSSIAFLVAFLDTLVAAHAAASSTADLLTSLTLAIHGAIAAVTCLIADSRFAFHGPASSPEAFLCTLAWCVAFQFALSVQTALFTGVVVIVVFRAR